MSYTAEELTWPSRMEYLANKASANKDIVFNNIGHFINVETLTSNFNKLDGTKAIGIDGVTKVGYRKNLESNIENLLKRIRSKSYKPKPSRIVEIPKDDGSSRPLAIGCLEDKIVQMATAELLSIIFEPIFLDCSFGFRAKKSSHDALRAVNKTAFKVKNGGVVEIDLKKYFNTIPHDELMSMLRKKISDRNFLELIEVLLKSPVNWENKTHINSIGAPQGSILSPILANIYLHYVIDEWFAAINKSHFNSRSYEIRYADDLIFFFESMTNAERFYKVLLKRLAKYGLTLNLEKSQILRSGSVAASQMHARKDACV